MSISPAPPRANRAMRALSWSVVRLRYLIVVAWIVATAAAVIELPGLGSAPSLGFSALLPRTAEPVRASDVSASLFPFPVLSPVVVAHHDPGGLPPGYEGVAAAHALQGALRSRQITAAVPVTNSLLSRREPPTTVVYYLFPHPDASLKQVQSAAQSFAAGLPHPPGSSTGISGIAPAELEHSNLVNDNLQTVELATILWVLFAVGLHFRSAIGPLVDVAAVAISYLLALHVVGWAGQHFAGSSGVPREAQPLIVVLLFGIVTDYTIFLLSYHRSRLRQGHGGRRSAALATRDVAGIVFVAGMTVCAATVCVTLSETSFFSSFGPALAISVFIAVIVSVTFVPAMLAILGRWAFWPKRPDAEGEESVQIDEAEEAAKGEAGAPLRGRIVRMASRHPIIVGSLVVIALLAGASGLRRYSLSVPELRSLPASAPAAHGFDVAASGFHAKGIVAPTLLILRGSGVARESAALSRLEDLLGRQPGVAAIIGPSDQPLAGDLGLARASSGDAVRYLLVLDTAPMGAGAIATLGRLEGRMPSLTRRAGLGRTRTLFGGQTSLARAVVQQTRDDLEIVGPAALGAIFLVIVLFLRAFVAPLYLVCASALSVATAMGITGYVHGDLIIGDGIEFFVPFATMVLLLALGSDYTVFLIGRIWREAPKRPLREAVIAASTRASHPITIAGIVLAGSFAMLALLPVTSYRTAAFTMAIGLLIDALIVRTLLVPALVSAFGRSSEAPGHQLEPKET